MNTPPRNRVFVFWIIWFAITASVPIYQFLLGYGLPSGKNAPGQPFPGIAFVAIAEVLAATAIRWMVLPRIARLSQQLVCMIVGLAAAESAELLGVFLIPSSLPEMKMLIFLLSLFGVIQFAPIYAREP